MWPRGHCAGAADTNWTVAGHRREDQAAGVKMTATNPALGTCAGHRSGSDGMAGAGSQVEWVVEWVVAWVVEWVVEWAGGLTSRRATPSAGQLTGQV